MIAAALVTALWIGLAIGWAYQRWGAGGSRDMEKQVLRRKRLLSGAAGPSPTEAEESVTGSDALKAFSRYSFNRSSRGQLLSMKRLILIEKRTRNAAVWFAVPFLIVAWAVKFPFGIALLAALGCIYGPKWYFARMKARYTQDFLSQLPPALNTLSSTLEVGHTVDAAIEHISRSAAEPLASEFRTIGREMQLGQTLTQAVQGLQKRVVDPDVQVFTTAVSVQQSTGGNLSEILKNLEETIRDRFALRREVRALSAEGRMSIIVLSLLPIGLALFQMMTNAKLMTQFLASGPGQMALLVCVGLQALGLTLFVRTTRLEDRS